MSRIVILKKNTLRIMNFRSREYHTSPLFKSNHFLKLGRQNTYNREYIFINRSFNNLLPSIFKSWFTFCSDVHNYQRVSSTTDKIFKPSYKTDSYGENSFTIGTIKNWNKTQYQFSNLSLKTYSPTKIKSLLFTNFIIRLILTLTRNIDTSVVWHKAVPLVLALLCGNCPMI